MNINILNFINSKPKALVINAQEFLTDEFPNCNTSGTDQCINVDLIVSNNEIVERFCTIITNREAIKRIETFKALEAEDLQRIVELAANSTREDYKTELTKTMNDLSVEIAELVTDRHVIVDVKCIDRDIVIDGVKKFALSISKNFKDIPVLFASDKIYDDVVSCKPSKPYTNFIKSKLGNK